MVAEMPSVPMSHLAVFRVVLADLSEIERHERPAHDEIGNEQHADDGADQMLR